MEAEINAIRKRLVELENARLEAEARAKVPPIDILEEFVEAKKTRIARKSYSKNNPLAEFYDREKVEFLQPILDALRDINERLDVIESRP